MNNKTTILTALAVISIVMMSACAPVYVPTAKHTPMLEEKGEMDLALQGGTNGFDVQGAYAITDKLGVIGAVSASDTEGSSSNSDHKHFVVEGGLDYFKKLGERGRFEAIGGLGFGTSEAKGEYNFQGTQTLTAKGSFSKYFLQSNIGLETKAADVGLALRMTQMVFSKFETSGTTYNDTKTGTFFEPSIFARLGWKKLKIETQLGFSAPFQQNLDFQYEPFTLSLGVRYSWNFGE